MMEFLLYVIAGVCAGGAVVLTMHKGFGMQEVAAPVPVLAQFPPLADAATADENMSI